MMSGRPPTPRGQAVLMGLIFLLVFSSYLTIQGFAVQLYGEALASDMEFVLYAVRGRRAQGWLAMQRAALDARRADAVPVADRSLP